SGALEMGICCSEAATCGSAAFSAFLFFAIASAHPISYPALMQQRRALVTGAAKRVGRAIALELGRAGARVAVHYRTSRAEAEATAAQLGGAPLVQGDQTVDPERIVSGAVEALGG